MSDSVACGGKVRTHTNDNEYYRRLITVLPEIVRDLGVSSPAVVEANEQTGTLLKCSAFFSKDDDRTLPPVVEVNFRDQSKKYQEQGEDVIQRETRTVEDFEAEKMGIFWPDHATEERKKVFHGTIRSMGTTRQPYLQMCPKNMPGGVSMQLMTFP